MLNKLKKINIYLERILISLGVLCFLFLIAVVLLQIATRLFIPISISWTEEISRFLFLYIIALVAPIALKERQLVFVDILLSYCSKRIVKVLKIISDLLVSVLSITVLLTSHNYVLLGIGQVAPVTSLPMYVPYFMVFILYLFLSIFSISNVIETILTKEE